MASLGRASEAARFRVATLGALAIVVVFAVLLLPVLPAGLRSTVSSAGLLVAAAVRGAAAAAARLALQSLNANIAASSLSCSKPPMQALQVFNRILKRHKTYLNPCRRPKNHIAQRSGSTMARWLVKCLWTSSTG